MNNKYVFYDTFEEDEKQYYNELINNIYGHSNFKKEDFCLTEADFYPPSDNRILESYIEDIDGGDNFADYCKDFFELLEEEGYYD